MKMKNLLTTAVIIFFFASICPAQGFVNDHNQWNVRHTYFGGYSTEIFIIGGDTVINNENYQAIWCSFDSLVSRIYFGALRENEDRVYYVPPGSTEGLLYDFTLSVGDTAYIRNFFCGDTDVPVVVSAVDTVVYYDIPRKRLHIGVEGYVSDIWVEGIGSLSGPLYSVFEYCIICPFWELLCFHQQDTLLYLMPYATTCYETSVGIEEPEAAGSFRVSPGIFSRGDYIVAEVPQNTTELMVYDWLGGIKQSVSPVNSETISINTADFAPGVYIITTNTTQRRVMTRKVICL